MTVDMIDDRSPQPKCAYSASGDLQCSDVCDSSGSFIEEPPVLSGEIPHLGQSTSVRASWPRRNPLNISNDVVYPASQSKRWSVASCGTQSGSALPYRSHLDGR